MIVELTLIAGAVCFVFALMDEKYGAVASDPNMWLNKGTIDGDETVLPRMLAYVTYYHQERIDISIESNNAKATHIRRGILLGVATPIISGLLLLLPVERCRTDTLLRAADFESAWVFHKRLIRRLF